MTSTITQPILQKSGADGARLNSVWKAILPIVAVVFGAVQMSAQLSGTITVPTAGKYTTLRDVVDSLNLYGVSGAVTVDITAAQTAPTGGYILGTTTLNNSVSSTNTLTFQGNGNVITGFLGTKTPGTTTPTFTGLPGQDAIISLKGTDYVTFNNLVFTDPTTNTTSQQAMENAIAMYNFAATSGNMNGCQNITITNCTFNFQNIGSNGHAIYATSSVVGGTANLSWSTEADRHRNITVTGCNFTDGFDPFWVRGSSADYTARNIKFNNNTALKIGGGTISVSAYGVATMYVDSVEMKNNTLALDSVGTNASMSYGMYPYYCGGKIDISNNTITLNRSAATQAVAGIYQYHYRYTTETVNSDITIRKNIINSGPQSIVAPTSSATTYGIYSYGYTYNYSTGSYSNSFATIDSNNVFSNQTIPGIGTFYGLTGSGAVSGAFGNTAMVNDNNLSNITRSGPAGTSYVMYCYGNKYTKIDNNDVTSFRYQNTTTSSTTTSTVYLIYNYSGDSVRISNNKLGCRFNTLSTGALTLYGTYTYGPNRFINNNTYHGLIRTNLSTGSSTIYGIINGSTSMPFDVYNNVMDSFITNGTAGVAYGMYNAQTNATTVNLYNNFFGEFYAPYSTNVNAISAYFGTSTATLNAYYNTVSFGRISPLTSTSTTSFGGSGFTLSTGTSIIRNNIINIKGTPGATGGSFVALRNTSTTAVNTKPSYMTASNNIYYVNPNANNYIYAQGTTAASLMNAYYTSGANSVGTLDANFNGACGLYKTFMGESSTFTEDNLVTAGVLANTYVPSGTSYAKSAALQISTPSITTDLNNVSRGTFPDMGALQFSATGVDASGPVITYNNIPNITCVGVSPTLSATITDPSGVNSTAGTKPRLYYKKSTDNDVFSANTSVTNGWKYVEASNAVSPFTFPVDYNIINGGSVATGDTIQYFVVAQDLSTTPNPTLSVASLLPAGTCPTSVDVGATAGITGTSVLNRFLIAPAPSFITLLTPTTSCQGDTIQHQIAVSNPTATGPTGYGASGATNTADDEIFSVTVGSMTNVSTCTSTGGPAGGPFTLPASIQNRYSNYTSATTPAVPVPDLISGNTYPWSLLLGTNSGNWSNGYSIFIDFNRNGVFDLPTEKIAGSTALTSTPNGCTAGTGVTFTGTFTVPVSGTQSGPTLLRVVQIESTAVPAPTGTFGWGETEDYTVNLIATPDPATTTYSWTSNKTGATILGTANPLKHATVDTNTIYTATVSVNGCPYTVNDTVHANPLPLAPTATNSTQCGSKVPTCKVTANNTFLAPPIYKWYATATSTPALQTGTEDSFLSAVISPATATSGPVNVYLYASVVDPITGCEGPRTQVTITTTYADNLWGKINNTPDSFKVCSGAPVNLTAGTVIVPPVTIYNTYTWSHTDPNSGISTPLSNATGSQTITPLSGGVYTLTVSAVSASGCQNLTTVKLIVQQNPFTAATKFAVADPNPACIGSTATHRFYMSNPAAVPPTGYCASTMLYTSDEEIKRVTLGSLDNATTCASLVGSQGTGTGTPDKYSDFTVGVPAPDVITGTSMPLTVEGGTCGGNYTNSAKAFFDWNQDGDFADAGEEFLLWSSLNGPQTKTVSIPIPTTASLGITRMRISQNESAPATITPCFTGSWGEVEDYHVNVLAVPVGTTFQWRSNQTGNAILSSTNPTAPLTLTVSPTIYTVKLTQGVCVDSAKDTVTNAVPAFTVNPIAGATSSCNGDKVPLSVSATGGCIPYTYAWSTTNGTLDTVNKSNTVFTPTGASGNKTVSVTVTDYSGATISVNTIINHNNPTPTAIVPDTICGLASATLGATLSNPGNVLMWFNSPTSFASLGQGSPFNTPLINTNTNYWVREVSSSISTIMPYPGYYSSILGQYGEMFTTTKPVIINSVDVVPIGTAGATVTVDIGVFDNAGNEVASTGNINFTIPTTNATAGAANTPVTLPIALPIPAAGVDYRMYLKSYSNVSSFNYMYNSPVVYPYTTTGGAFTLTSGCFGATTLYPNYKFTFYNFAVEEGCFGEPVKDSVTVLAPPAFSLAKDMDSMCSGLSTAPVNISTPLTNYNTYTWTPSTSISGDSSTGYVFSETVPATYTYVLKAQQTSGLMCASYDTLTLKVKPVPNAFNINPMGPLSICNGTVQPLDAVSTVSVDGKIGTGTTSVNSPINPFYTSYTDKRSQMVYTASELTALGFKAGKIDSIAYFLTSNTVSTTTLPTFAISIKMGNTSVSDYSTTGVFVTTPALTTVYTNTAYPNPGPPTTVPTMLSFPFTTPFIWDGTSNVVVEICQDNTTTNGAIAFQNTYMFPVYPGMYSYETNATTGLCNTLTYGPYTYTYRPNAHFYQTIKYPMTWTPTSGLFSNSSVSSAYTGVAMDTVYAAPADTIKYFAVATHSNGCVTKDSITINVTDTATITVQPVALTTLCEGSSLSLSVTATSSSPLTYQWRKNGINITTNASATTNNLMISGTALADSGTYDVLVSTGAPCSAKASTQAVVKIKRQPVITTQPSPVNVCQNVPFNLVSAGSGDSAVKWTQIGGSNTASTYTYSNASAQFADTGNYYVTYLAASPCVNVNSDTVHVSVLPKAVIVTQPTTLSTLCIGQTKTLKATYTGALGFQWLKNGAPIVGATNDSLVVTASSQADSGTYQLIVKSPLGCNDDTTSINAGIVKVNLPVSITTQPASVTQVCQNAPFTLSVTASNATAYIWKKNGVVIPGSTSSIYTDASAALTDAGNYTVEITGLTSCPNVTSTVDTVKVTPLAVITLQPVAQTVCFGQTMTFTTNATNATAGYQWLFNGNPIAGATSSTYTVASATYADSGMYSVIAKPANSCATATSSSVLGKVNHPVNITTQPSASAIGCIGASFTALNVTADNATSYQWMKGGVDIAGQTSSTLTINPFAGTDVGSYSVKVSGIGTCPVVTSNSSTVTSTSFASITMDLPSNADVCISTGYTRTLRVTAVDAQSYQWYKNGTAIAGETKDSLVINGTAGVAGSYKVIAYAYAGCTNDTSATTTLVESTPITLSTVAPNKASHCVGNNLSMAVTATGSGSLSYQWVKGSTNVGTNANTYSKTSVVTTDSGDYKVVVSTTTSCPAATSNIARVNVNAAPVVSLSNISSTTLCIGQMIDLAATASSYNSLTWYKGSTNVGTGSTLTKTAAASDNGVYTVLAAALPGCTDVVSNPITLNITTPASISVQPASAQLIENTDYTLTVVPAGTPPFTYQWYKDGIAIPVGGTSNTFAITNYNEAAHQGTYTVDVTSAAPCNNTVTSTGAVITTTKCPQFAPITVTTVNICEGNTFSIDVTATGAASYQWYRNGVKIPGAIYPNYSIVNSTTAHAGTYRLRAYEFAYPNPICTDTISAPIVVNVGAKPVITKQPVKNPDCSPSTYEMSVTATNASTYQWYKNSVAIPSATTNKYTTNSITTFGDTFQVAVNSNLCPSAMSNAIVVKSFDPILKVALTPNDQMNMVEQCYDVNGWTYYSNPNDDSKFYLAIRKFSNSGITASPDVQLRSQLKEVSSLNVENRGAIFGTRFFNIDFNGNLVSPYDVKFYYAQAEEDLVMNRFNTIKNAEGTNFTTNRTKLSFITSTETPFTNSLLNYVTMPLNFQNTIVSDDDFGVDNGVKYVIVKNLVAQNGGGTMFMDYFIKKAGSSAVNNSNGITFNVNLYPVPTPGELNVEITSTTLKPFTLVVTDMMGRVVDTRDVRHNATTTKHTLDLGHLSNGSYQIQVSNGDESSATKFSIVK